MSSPIPLKIAITATYGNFISTRNTSVLHDNSVGTNKVVTAAKAGTLTTRTNDASGTLTMGSGHGIQTGDILQVFWSGGTAQFVVGTVAGTSVPIASGVGTVLPDAATAITAKVPEEETFSILDTSGVNGLMIACGGDGVQAHVVFYNTTTKAEPFTVTGKTGDYFWDSSLPGTNPLTGQAALTRVLLSHGSTSDQTMTVVALLD
jgi:hypothetical protein